MDFDGATGVFERAIELIPDRVEYYMELAKVLEVRQRYDEGIDVLKKAIEHFKANKQTDAIAQLSVLLEFFEFRKWGESRKEGSPED